jgi:hypothetical protein
MRSKTVSLNLHYLHRCAAFLVNVSFAQDVTMVVQIGLLYLLVPCPCAQKSNVVDMANAV